MLIILVLSLYESEDYRHCETECTKFHSVFFSLSYHRSRYTILNPPTNHWTFNFYIFFHNSKLFCFQRCPFTACSSVYCNWSLPLKISEIIQNMKILVYQNDIKRFPNQKSVKYLVIYLFITGISWHLFSITFCKVWWHTDCILQWPHSQYYKSEL